VRRAISNSAVRPVVIVPLDPTNDRCSRFFQAAMEPFDVAVAFLVIDTPSADG